MKATDRYFPVVLFIELYKVVLTFESVDEILKRDTCIPAKVLVPNLSLKIFYKIKQAIF